MLGISIYLGTEEIGKQEEYIRYMHSHGFTSIFTSLHIPEDDPLIYKQQLIQLGDIARGLKMELFADVSSQSLHALGFTWDHASEILKWGVTGLRIDFGIDDEIIIRLSHEMKIALNASTLKPESIQDLIDKGLRIEACEMWHNFYPRAETGLGWSDFVQRNQQFQQMGLTVMAFIPGDEQLRGPVFAGLPTVERHRTYSPFASFNELKEQGYVDKVLIGDIRVSNETIEQFTCFREKVIVLRCEADEHADITFIQSLREDHTNRADVARDIVRSIESRHYAEIKDVKISARHCIERPIGTITVDNEKYARYQGEFQITKRDLQADERVNVLGRVIEEDRALLAFIGGEQKYRLKWV